MATRSTQQLTGPNGTTLSIRTIDPTTARELLALNLTPEQREKVRENEPNAHTLMTLLNRSSSRRNRLISETQWRRHARDMATGKWNPAEGTPIHIDVDGYMVHGQHRMLAVIESGKSIEFVVINNVSRDVQLVTDTGRSQTMGDKLSMTGVANANTIAAAAVIVLKWRSGNMTRSSFRPSTTEQWELINSTPDFHTGTIVAGRIRAKLPRAVNSVITAAYVEAVAIDVDACEEFFDALRDGTNLDRDNPVALLRQRIINYDTTWARDKRRRPFYPYEKLWHVVRAWNAYRKAETLQRLAVPTSLTSLNFPKMV